MSENVYKIGRTTDIYERISAYPKSSKVLYIQAVIDYKSTENIVLKALHSNENLKHRPDIGKEWFEGSFEHLKNTVANSVKDLHFIDDEKMLEPDVLPREESDEESDEDAELL
jgi:hypothetical protein